MLIFLKRSNISFFLLFSFPLLPKEMISPHAFVRVVEHSKISPPKRSTPPTTLSLTFFDIPWLLFTPNQPLFFYDFPHITTHFCQTILPNLKHSLSLTLQHFFPLAGNLILPPEHPSNSKPHLIYNENDGISFQFQEFSGDFQLLSGHHPRNVVDFYQLVPHFKSSQANKYPILSVNITFFPLQGFSIGFDLRQVAADGRTFDNFLKTWAAIYKLGQQQKTARNLESSFAQCHQRDMIHDPIDLEKALLKQWWHLRNVGKNQTHVKNVNGCLSDDVVRATFLVGPPDMHKLREWVLTRSMDIFGSTQLLLSPYVVTCAFIWVCLMKTRFNHFEDFLQVPHYLGFIAGGIHRLGYSVPKNYVGNCIAFGRAMVKRGQLIGKDGVIHAAKALGETIKELDREVLGKAKNWIPDWNVMFGSELHVMITGSPKVGCYDLDFGWGRPIKVEEMSINKTNAISLCESRDVKGGIEVGLALPKGKMDVFSSLVYEGLKRLQ